MEALGRRLAAVERREQERRTDRGPMVLAIHPDDWPREDRDAYDAVGEAGDHEARRDLVERYAGRRRRAGTTVIEFRVRADGPA